MKYEILQTKQNVLVNRHSALKLAFHLNIHEYTYREIWLNMVFNQKGGGQGGPAVAVKPGAPRLVSPAQII